MSKNTIKMLSDITLFKSLLLNIPTRKHFKIDACNDFVLPIDWGFENRINSNYHLAYVKSGSILYLFEKEEIKIDKGMIVFVSKDFCHSRILLPFCSPRMVLVRFNLLNNTDLLPSSENCEPFAFAYAPTDPQKYYNLLNLLVRYYRTPITDHSVPIANTLLQQVLFEICDDLSILHRPVIADPRIEKTIQFVKKNMNHTVSIAELSSMVGLSENHYRYLFEKTYNMNPKQYFVRTRAQNAFELLTETSRSIKDISSELGYSDQYAFSKQFKSVFGKSPSQVRPDR